MVRRSVPNVRVVSGVDLERPLGARLRGAGRALRPAGQVAAQVLVGFWPLWAVSAFAFGLCWVFALSASP
ncbi:MAG TPA: hypothetical protein VK698_28980 [Kofleriaceae bacterium]|nr:hypothetical protein [Kofleriaceae bacterium]